MILTVLQFYSLINMVEEFFGLKACNDANHFYKQNKATENK